MQQELDPMRDRLARLVTEEENERTAWEARLHAKEDEVKTLKARLSMREKRLLDENHRRNAELEKLRKQVTLEAESVKAHYESERTRLEKLLFERRETLARLQATENDLRKSGVEMNSLIVQAAQQQRQELDAPEPVAIDPQTRQKKQGYEWFGQTAPPHEALTAYGLMEFRDMAKVYDVDKAMLDRTQKYLMDQKDGKGGFKRNPRALDTFGRAPEPIRRPLGMAPC